MKANPRRFIEEVQTGNPGYSHFYKSALYDSLRRIDFHLRAWVRRKYKRFKQKPKSARE